jgi:hypothetical protein
MNFTGVHDLHYPTIQFLNHHFPQFMITHFMILYFARPGLVRMFGIGLKPSTWKTTEDVCSEILWKGAHFTRQPGPESFISKIKDATHRKYLSAPPVIQF